MKGDILGHIDCPACGFVGGMRITEDKSGAPFGYCELNCDQQMRIGGNGARIKQFYAKHPHIKQIGEAVTIPETTPGPEVKPVTVTEKKPEVIPVTVTAKKTPHWAELLGVKNDK